MIDYTHFKFCPSCGQSAIKRHQKNAMQCLSCGYIYFHNTASAVAAILRAGDRLVLVKRNHGPKKGFYDLPGGFVDRNESAETAVRREIREELDIGPRSLKYFDTFPNTYRFGNVTYFTCDIIFVGVLPSRPLIMLNDEIAAIEFIRPADIDYKRIAFTSVRSALKKYALTR
jgi:ADP-ribose pyrophosphatase YjhB (NUDIX family)